MTQSEKLQKLMERAIEGKWFDVAGFNGYTIWNPVGTYDVLVILEDKETHTKRQYNYQAIIFNYDFARALFGGDFVCSNDGSDISQDEAKDTPWRVTCNYENGDYSSALEAFKYHLQQAVISEDPISYMYEQVFGNDENIKGSKYRGLDCIDVQVSH